MTRTTKIGVTLYGLLILITVSLLALTGRFVLLLLG